MEDKQWHISGRRMAPNRRKANMRRSRQRRENRQRRQQNCKKNRMRATESPRRGHNRHWRRSCHFVLATGSAPSILVAGIAHCAAAG